MDFLSHSKHNAPLFHRSNGWCLGGELLFILWIMQKKYAVEKTLSFYMLERVVHIVYRVFQRVNMTDYCTEKNLMTEWTNSRLADDTVSTAWQCSMIQVVRNWKPEKSFLRQPTTETSLEGFPLSMNVENIYATLTLVLGIRHLCNITGKLGSQKHELLHTRSQLVIRLYFIFYYFFVISDMFFLKIFLNN